MKRTLDFTARTHRERSSLVRIPRRRSVAATFVATASVLVVATSVLGACGSRTGLFAGDDDLQSADASVDGSSSIADAGPDATPCIPGRFDLNPATAQLMFVIDRSGSMAFRLTSDQEPAPGQPSRWQTLRNALAESVPAIQGEIAMGAKFFPERLPPGGGGDPDLACMTSTGVSIPPALDNLSRILTEFDTSNPSGGTPTAEALRLAASDLSTRRTVARTIVLATDGAPNCNSDLDWRTCVCTAAISPATNTRNCRNNDESCLDDRATLDVMRGIFQEQKIPVFVIGLGGSDPQYLDVLDRMAIAGGRPRTTTPRHYNVQSSAELGDALRTISDSIARCTYLTPSAPTDPDAISINIDGTLIPRDLTHTEGWDWVDIQYGTIAFFGKSCEVAQVGASKVSGQVSCEP